MGMEMGNFLFYNRWWWEIFGFIIGGVVLVAVAVGNFKL